MKFSYLYTKDADRLVGSILKHTNVPPHYKAALVLMRYTGARIGEVQAVVTEDFVVMEVMGKATKAIRLRTLKRKDHPVRLVPLPDDVWDYAKREAARAGGSLRKADRSYMRKILQRVGKKLGIEARLLHPHVFRHTRAIEFLASGMNMAEVAGLLGHKAIMSTMVYLKIAPVDLSKKMSALGLI